MEKQRKREGVSGVAGSKLSPQALDILRSLDSLSYGLLDLQCNGRSGSGRDGSHLLSISRDLIKQGITHMRGSVAKFSYSPHSQSQLICQIGHLHLLLEEFAHAYSAYSQYRQLSPSSESDPALFYGLGIIYCRQGQLKQSEECYKKVLSLAPSFPRSGEVHLRLGLLLKKRRAFEEAATHFNKAINKPDPQLDKFLIQFHSAHLCQLQGQSSQARSKYEVLLGCRTLSPHVKALTQKQFGWLLHRSPVSVRKHEEEGVRGRALELLKQAAQGLPECGETWYLLGRVLVTHQRYHEAFAAYQKAIRYPSKISTANTWHSIGHLYFQMQQPRDSLQAYLCCVYLEIHHLQGWKSLGCLYEAVVYPVEALLCYQNAMIAFTKKCVNMGKDIDYVRSRVTALNQYLTLLGGRAYLQNPGMPLLLEAWTTLVPDHIRRKQPSPGTPILSLHQCYTQPQSNSMTPTTPFPLPNYPPPPTPITPVTPGSMMGITGSGNFIPPTPVVQGKNGSKSPRKKKKPPAVRTSSGSTPSPSTSTAHSTPTKSHSIQNGNGNLTRITAMECNQNGMETAPTESRTMATGADLDLNGLNLDSIDFDALTAAANAIPSPASLAARSHVQVSSATHPKAASTTKSTLLGNPTVPSTFLPSSLSSTFPTCSPSQPPTGISTSHSPPLQAATHTKTAVTTTPLLSLTQAVSSALSSKFPCTSPSLPPTDYSTIQSSGLSCLEGGQPPLTAEQSRSTDSASHVINSVGSLYQNSSEMSDSRTPDTASSQHSLSCTFNWPSYLVSANQPSSSPPATLTSENTSPQLQPMASPPFPSLSTHPALSLAPPPPASAGRLTTATSTYRPPAVTVLPSQVTTSSLSEKRRPGKASENILPCKRRSSATSSSSRSKSSRNRQILETGVTNPPQPSSGGLAPSSMGGGGRPQTTVPLPPPLPPHMASEPSLLSRISATSLSSSFLPPASSLPNQPLPFWTTSTVPGQQGSPTFVPNSNNHVVPLPTTSTNPQSSPSFVPNGPNRTVPFPGADISHLSSMSVIADSQNQTLPPPTTGTNDLQSGTPFVNGTIPSSTTLQSGMPFAPNGHSQTIPLPTTTTDLQDGPSHSHPPHSVDLSALKTKPRVSPEKAKEYLPPGPPDDFSPFHLHVPMSQVSTTHTSQSTFYSTPSLLNTHQDHPHKNHTHKTRLHSESRKAKSKTVHHFSSKPQFSSPLNSASAVPLTSIPPASLPLTSIPLTSLPPASLRHNSLPPSAALCPNSLPPATFAGLPLFSPSSGASALPPSSLPPATFADLPLFSPPQHQPLAPSQDHRPHHTQQVTLSSSSSSSSPENIPLQEAAANETTQTSPTRAQSMTELLPDVGPTMTVLTSEESTSQQTGEPARPPTPSTSDVSPAYLPVTSVQSLVNQLFAVLQKDNATTVGNQRATDALSDTSSGISSAGTKLSTTSTAESSPANAMGHQAVTTPSLSPYSPRSLLPPSVQLPPSVPAALSSPPYTSPHSPISPSLHSPHTVPTPVNETTMQPQLSTSGPSPPRGANHSTVMEEVENGPPVFTNCHHQSNSIPRQTSRERLRDVSLLKNSSRFVAPRVPFPSLASAEEYMVLEPEFRPPSPPPFHDGMELRPDCPMYKVTSCEDAMSTSLHEFCTNPSHPICLIRGLVEAVGLDLNLFSSESLVESHPDHEMEVREQMKQAADENCDVVTGKQIWRCESSKSITTVTEYARYQQRMLQKEAEEDHSDYLSDTGRGEGSVEREFLSFGTNVDISDGDIWSDQLDELYKLPHFLRVTCPETNLLSHIGHTVLGMNSVQLYMKVAGSRTPGHQENNNFCSLNINIGPGDCEWFAVPNSYWGIMHELCEKHKVHFLVGSWWPILDELYRHKIPVYRFTQYKGDVVYINPGTVHWVQANRTCNNIAWNTGPLTAHQFRMAWERYQWNKVQKVRSIVPMIHLTWNLARSVRLTDSHFYSQVRSLLESSLAQTNLLLSHLQKAGIPVLWHGRLDGEPAPYCNSCMEEVFNILFVLSHRGEYLVYCHRCASSMRKTFTVLQQYLTEDLERVVAGFRRHPPYDL